MLTEFCPGAGVCGGAARVEVDLAACFYGGEESCRVAAVVAGLIVIVVVIVVVIAVVVVVIYVVIYVVVVERVFARWVEAL